MEGSGVVGAIRRRAQPNSENQHHQQKEPQNAAARWRLASGIRFSRPKQTPLHNKPLHPQAYPTAPSAPSVPPGPSGRVLSTRASSKRTIVAGSTKHQKAAVEQPPDGRPRPKSILDPAPAGTLDKQEEPPTATMVPSNAVTSKPEKSVAAMVRGGRPNAGGKGTDLILIGGRFGSTALPRSGSAPASSAMILTKYPATGSGGGGGGGGGGDGNNTSSVHHRQENKSNKNRVPLLGGVKRPGLLLEPGPSRTPTALSCWDEGGGTGVVLIEATTLPQRHGAARSWDGSMGNGTTTAVSEQNGDKGASPNAGAAGAAGAGWKDPPPISQHVDPLPLGKSARGKRKQLLSPLHRRKSDVTDSKRVHTARAEAASAAPKTTRVGRRSSDTTLPTTQLSQPSSGRLLRCNIAPDATRAGQKSVDARQGATIQNLSASRPRTHAGRWGASSGRCLRNQAGYDERVGQGQLKARTRVIEWKRRQSDGLKAKGEEGAVTLEQKEQAEAALEAARKLAATRAEEAERRKLAERENSAGVGRAADVAEKWAKHSLERRRRRAEIYAINAIMRAAFEKDFKAYSLEKERQAREVSPITFQCNRGPCIEPVE